MHSDFSLKYHQTLCDLNVFGTYLVEYKCQEEVLYLQPLIPPKRFDISFPITGGCSEGLGEF